MTEQTMVTRFPPSPTGYLHIGGARTALFNWALARKHGGRFILRLEDTDQARSSIEAARSIIADLRWLGLDWDEGPAMPQHWTDPLKSDTDYDPYANQTGEHGPYAQSQRLDRYRQHLETLRKADMVYDDDGAVRFRVPKQDITFTDIVRGEVTTPADQLEDFVIFKSDGFPTYHFAVIVDDHEMGVNTIVRGQDHLSNTAKHIALQQALGFDQPRYAHMSLTTNPDGSKMGKRDKAKVARAAAREAKLEAVEGVEPDAFAQFMAKKNDEVAIAIAIAGHLDLDLPEIDVRDFRDAGYLPKTLVNYLGLLGWNPGGDVEDFGDDPLAFLAEHFDPARLIRGNATFDRQKLLAFNADRIRAMEAEPWRQLLWDALPDDGRVRDTFTGPADHRFGLFAEAYQQRCSLPRDAVELGAFFFVDDSDIAYDEKAVKKVLAKNDGVGFAVLKDTREMLSAVPPVQWQAEALEAKLKAFSEDKQIKMGNVAQPIRVAVTGNTVSPPIGVTLEILGQEASITRMGNCLLQTASSA